MSHYRIAILGGGPIGLEAAIACRKRGFSTVLYEQGTLGHSLQQWQHIRLFSPFQMNSSSLGRSILREAAIPLPSPDSLQTGKEFLETYLFPLSQMPALKGCLQEQTRVVAVGRDKRLKGELIGKPERGTFPFRILIESNGQQQITTADSVLDCTGTFGNHNWLGSGGIPCPGEFANQRKIRYDLPCFSENDKQRYVDRTTLVVGSGYSAATNVVNLHGLAEEFPRTKIYWLTRNCTDVPIPAIAHDSLPERVELTRRSQQLVRSSHSHVQWLAGYVVERIDSESATDRLRIELTAVDGKESKGLFVDEILGNVGFRPDRTLYEELQIHECYASHGPMKLAASLLGETSADCLQQTSHGIETLVNPEPNYFILGAKSYGRNSRFLLRIGIDQVNQVIEWLSADESK